VLCAEVCVLLVTVVSGVWVSEVDMGGVWDVVVAVCLCLLFSRRRPVDANDEVGLSAQALDVLLACASSSLTRASARMNRRQACDQGTTTTNDTSQHSLTSANRDHI
jgi:hypothetical protein